MNLTMEDVFRRAVQAHSAGDLGEAEKFYTTVLEENPNHADANHNMGIILASLGKEIESINSFEGTIKVLSLLTGTTFL